MRMGYFENLPAELIIEIYKYLPRRDRMSCSKVCNRWKEALNSPVLWRNMVIYLDLDLMEPSTLILTREYYVYLKSLALGWANREQPYRWLPQRSQEVTKRVCRYILTLFECYVQLQSIAFFEWYEINRLKKVTYHLCRFLRNQINLTRISFNNANLDKNDCIRLLASCLTSQETITCLDLFSCCYLTNIPFDLSIHIVTCVQQLVNLKCLKLDYSTLSRGVIDAIIRSKNKSLDTLHVTIFENMFYEHLVSDEEWVQLKKHCPDVKVALYIKNIEFFVEIRIFLNATLPLYTFSLQSHKQQQIQSYNDFRQTFEWIIKNYSRTLENLTIHIRNNNELIDDLLLKLVKQCPNLQYFEFHGVIESMEFMREICKCQVENEGSGLKYLRFMPKSITEESHLTIKNIFSEYTKEIEENVIDLKIYNNKVRNFVYVYY